MLIPSRNRPIWQMCKIFTFHDSSRAYIIQESRNVISYCSIPGIFVPSWSRPIWQINKRFTFLDLSRVYTIQESRNHIARFKKCWYHPGFDQYDKYTRDLHSSTLPGHIQFKNLGMFLYFRLINASFPMHIRSSILSVYTIQESRNVSQSPFP